jgi:type VI secretion system protein ImpC
MTKDSVVNSFNVNLTAGTPGQTSPESQSNQTPTPVAPDEPFCILILGDFSGRTSRGIVEPDTLADRVVHTVDRDTFDELLGKLKPELHLAIGRETENSVTLAFGDLADFHPDQLYESVDLFAELRGLRRRLQNADTFTAAARQMGAIGGTSESTTVRSATADGNAASFDGGSLLDAALEATSDQPPEPLVDRLIKEIVAPYVIPAADPRLPDLLASVDTGIADLMRRLLHHPDFQHLEANWRGLYSLVRNLETNRTLKVDVLDVSLDEVRADLCRPLELSQTAFYRRIVDGLVQATGQCRPAVITACWQFQPTVDDVELLGRLASVAEVAEAPILGAAASTMVGCSSFAEFPDPDDWASPPPEFLTAWNKLRSRSAASFLGLILPRFLLRRPYCDDIEAFAFEELPDPATHSSYLWGNAAWLCAQLLGEAFTANRWQLQPQQQLEVDGLAMHFFEEDGETVAKPCAEGWLTSRGAMVIGSFGLVPLLSVHGRDAVSLGVYRSISDTPLILKWRWGGRVKRGSEFST